MAILQVGLKSSVWPRRKRWYRSFCWTRLQLAWRGQNVAKNSATCWRTGGKVLCWGTGGGTLLGRPSSNTEYSARPPTRSAIFGHVLASPGQLEPSSAKWLSPSFLSRQNTTFKPNLSNCQWIPLRCICTPTVPGSRTVSLCDQLAQHITLRSTGTKGVLIYHR